LKTGKDAVEMTPAGKSFHRPGAATPKTRSPALHKYKSAANLPLQRACNIFEKKLKSDQITDIMSSTFTL